MANILEYTLTLKDFVSAKLQKIGINNDTMLEKFAELEKVQKKVSRGFAQMGTSVHTLQQKIALLKAERDLLPIGSLSAIRKYNSEINKLEHSVSKLQTLNGSKLKTWFSEALNSLPGLATNPLILAGAGIGMSIRKGMEADLQQANITTLLRGDVEKAKALYAQLSDYGVKTPYDKAGLIEAQKTMMSFGLSSEFAFGKLKNIGDIAMGDVQKMQSLSLAFAQATSAGKLQGQDLMQMINAGFNPLQVISERTGESMAQLKERMSKGGISAQELAQAFEWATDKQGLFYQGAEKAGQTLSGKFNKMMDSITELALKVYEAISPVLSPLVDLAAVIFSSIGGGIGWLIEKFQEGNPIIWGIAGAIGIFTTALILHNTYTAIATAWQNRLTWAVIKTNLAFLANPITWIIVGIIALIAIIAYCIVGVSGWGKAWEYTVQGMKYSWEAFVENFQLLWTVAKNTFMAGIDACKLAWYKFKEAVGLGDSTENQAMINKIQNDLQERAKSVTEGYKKANEAGEKAKEAFGKAWDSLEFKSFKEVKDGLMGKLGMKTESSPAPGVSPIMGETTATTGEGTKTKDNIVSGGTRQTHINIQIGNVGTDTKVYVSSVREGVENFGEMVKEELLRVVNSINQMQTA
ncbi:tape measure domain-containing protein [Capnocytophaga leadbetteri]|uniref:Tape measure domain-containing protein n=2 Tax=Capnocytophaga leadbetteri TaxID=327575 RepID=A0A2T5XXC7_9FLAO|nr:tape measure domain-containing protein [Capnocytophaga leadbetteri]